MKTEKNILNEKKLLLELGIKTAKDLAACIDYTNVKPNVSSKVIEQLCKDARREQFRAVSVNPCWLDISKKCLVDSNIRLCAAISFPFGSDTTETKVAAVENAILHGANDLDVVINIGLLKDQNEKKLMLELKNIVQKRKEINQDVLVKIIIETPLLNNEEKIIACNCCISAEADYIKTSTGFCSEGRTTIEDIKLIKEFVGDKIGIKASGGIRTLHDTLRMMKAGADLVGTSLGLNILEEMRLILHNTRIM